MKKTKKKHAIASSPSVSLSEEDISGVSFGTRKSVELGNDALISLLKCHGDKCKGLKAKAQLLKQARLRSFENTEIRSSICANLKPSVRIMGIKSLHNFKTSHCKLAVKFLEINL